MKIIECKQADVHKHMESILKELQNHIYIIHKNKSQVMPTCRLMGNVSNYTELNKNRSTHVNMTIHFLKTLEKLNKIYILLIAYIWAIWDSRSGGFSNKLKLANVAYIHAKHFSHFWENVSKNPNQTSKPSKTKYNPMVWVNSIAHYVVCQIGINAINAYTSSQWWVQCLLLWIMCLAFYTLIQNLLRSFLCIWFHKSWVNLSQFFK